MCSEDGPAWMALKEEHGPVMGTREAWPPPLPQGQAGEVPLECGKARQGGRRPSCEAVMLQPPPNLAGGVGGPWGGAGAGCARAHLCVNPQFCPPASHSPRPSAPARGEQRAPVQSLRQRSWVPRNPDAGAALYLRTRVRSKTRPRDTSGQAQGS